jgi:SH3-like domain-containing protein
VPDPGLRRSDLRATRSRRRWALTSAWLALLLVTALPGPALAAEPSAGPEAVEPATPPPSAEPTPEPTATPGSTATPTPVPTVEPTAEPTAGPTATPVPAERGTTPIWGYRYTIEATALRAEASGDSSIVADLPADAQLQVSERLEVDGVAWASSSYLGASGYVEESRLSTTSAPRTLVVDRYTRVEVALRTAMSDDASLVRYIQPGAIVHNWSVARDALGRSWGRVSLTIAGTKYRGYQLWSTTTTMPVAVSGTWTVYHDTHLYRYPYAGASLRALSDGDRVTRLARVVAGNGSRWTKVRIGTRTGWVRSRYITGPYRQYIWDRRNPVTQQYTNYWCVPASVQTELNMALDRQSTSYSYQQTVYHYGRANLGYRLRAVGLDPQAWARSLTYFSNERTPYWDAIYTSYDRALRAGVRSMRRTGQPVGLLVYHGGHAWTMIGYTATADPRKTSKYKVTGVYVAAPFVAWTDPRPGTYYSTAAFRYKMTTYWEPERWTRWNGYYTIILPR